MRIKLIVFLWAVQVAALCFFPQMVFTDDFQDHQNYLADLDNYVQQARDLFKEAGTDERFDTKSTRGRHEAHEHLIDTSEKYRELNEKVKILVEANFPTYRKLKERRKELFQNLDEGLIDRQDLSSDEVWLVTQFTSPEFQTENETKILKKSGLDSKSAEEFTKELEDEIRAQAGEPLREPKDKKKTPAKKTPPPKIKGETKKEEPPVKKEQGPVVKKEPEPKTDDKKTPGDPFENLTDKQKDLKKTVEKKVAERPERVSQDERGLLDTVFGDQDLIDLFFPDEKPPGKDDQSSKDKSKEKTPNARDVGMDAGDGDGFGASDQLGGGVGGMLGGGGSSGSGGGPSSRDMTPQRGGAGMNQGAGEGHQHAYVGGVARDA